MFQDGSFKTISSKDLARGTFHMTLIVIIGMPSINKRNHNPSTRHLVNSVVAAAATMVYKKLFRKRAPPSQSARPASTTDLDSCGRRTETRVTACQTPHNTGLNRFPFNNFTHCLTAFSRCFSSFPHGTCSLSVSCQYLALDEIYHPL